MDNPIETAFPIRLMSFKQNDETGDVVVEATTVGDLTEHGDFPEVAFDYRKERIYVSFRLSDFRRALAAASKA